MLDVSAVAILVDGVDNRESFVVIGGREFRGGIVSEGGKCSGRPRILSRASFFTLNFFSNPSTIETPQGQSKHS
ncbi:hypothetical protein Bca4012_005060 [Brassica carinata]|uniref:Uncharacterized protein n=2 Tax=Brassica TaxID=3705 RepID=A0A3P6BF44_BRAOL|nr:unnamed protein product [Brassica napus]VDC94618.1 unnamed protein product [Brassica oleracea]